MAEYIEREAVIVMLCQNMNETSHDYAAGISVAVDAIDSFPAADVVARDCFNKILAENDDMRAIIDTYGGLENIQSAFVKLHEIEIAEVRPVVRGHWINGRKNVDWDKQNPGCPESSCFCSVCGDWLTASDEYPCRGNYCPNCGADMREVE